MHFESGTDAELFDVWGSAPNDIWAVGANYADDLSATGVILHWDGSVWTIVEDNISYGLWRLWGSSSDDVWAVGGASVFHWDGTYWSSVYSGPDNLVGIWGTDTGDVWVVGYNGAVIHRQGDTWTRVDIMDSSYLYFYDVWGTNSDSIWIVGTEGQSPYSSCVIAHWDGIEWSVEIPALYDNVVPNDIWGTSYEDIWVVGREEDVGEHIAVAKILHWNGREWSHLRWNEAGFLWGVHGMAADDVWAVGMRGAIGHWNGQSWANITYGTKYQLEGVWGTAADDVWAVGVAWDGYGPIYDDKCFIHWDGQIWSSVSSGSHKDFYGVWGAATDDV